ncbi:MAG: response regulator [Ignavibacteriales bacterium]|nr:response regulator [Ignavibacteriales bacterium]
MGKSIFLGLVLNTALLIALGLIYNLIRGLTRITNRYVKETLIGLSTGAIGIAIMGTPWVLMEGVVFDTRSVLISISGMFFGTIPTIIGMVMMSLFRLSSGGSGMEMGIATVVVCGSIGIIWRNVRQGKVKKISLSELYLFGIVVHLGMMLCTLFLPEASREFVFKAISLPVLVIYPVAELLLGWMLLNGEETLKTRVALVESESKFRRLFDTVDEAIFLLDREGRVLDSNKGAERMFGYSSHDLLNQGADFFAAPGKNDVSQVNQFTQRAFDGESKSFEFWVIRKNGEVFLSLVKLYPATFKDENAVIALAIDLSERIKHELELKEAKDRAESANKLKSNFLANMSHELRTPMIGIMGYSEMIMETEESPEIKRSGEKIFESAQRLMQTLNLILDLSKIESGYTEINSSRFDVISVIKDMTSKLQVSAAKKNLTFVFKSTLNELFVVTDPRLLHHVFANLFDNALKFTHEGGVEISLELEVIKRSKWLVLVVKDTGIGISEQDQSIIWDEFRQVSEGWGRGYEGTGLGLSLTKRFIKKMGGEIRVESRLGEGSTFIVKLPYNEDTRVTGSEEEVMEMIESVDKLETTMDTEFSTILIVDDDDISLDVTVAFLKHHYTVHTAKNVVEAFELINKNRYSIILLDINLGKGVTGFQILEELKKRPDYAGVPVIAVTAYAMAGDKAVFLRAGCTDYVSKPFTRSTLLKVCEKVTSGK